jgi:HAD superfamily hydrolase (TIGR01509 family)
VITALIFDFDGLVADTETPDYVAWQEVYSDHGCELPPETWSLAIGSAHLFNAYDHLESLLDRPIDRLAIKERVGERFRALMGELTPLPGVVDYLAAAPSLNLQLAVASSASRSWVTGNLRQLGLIDRFATICTSDDVERTKPEPDLYLLAAERLGVPPAQAVALEDSPNGVWAAKAAGMRCVAVPNAVTRLMDLSHADLVVPSLAAVPLPSLLEQLVAQS